MAHLNKQEYTFINDICNYIEDTWSDDAEKCLRDYRFSDDFETAGFGPLSIIHETKKDNAETIKVIQEYMFFAQDYVRNTYGHNLQPVNTWKDMSHMLFIVQDNFGDTEWGAFLQPHMGNFDLKNQNIKFGVLVVNTGMGTALERHLTLQHEMGHVIDWVLDINTSFSANLREQGIDYIVKSQDFMKEQLDQLVYNAKNQREFYQAMQTNIVGLIQQQIDLYCEDPMEAFTAELQGAYHNCPDEKTARWLAHSGFFRLATLLRGFVKLKMLKKKHAKQIYLNKCTLFANQQGWQRQARDIGRRTRVLA